jgi:hypothetical protein
VTVPAPDPAPISPRPGVRRPLVLAVLGLVVAGTFGAALGGLRVLEGRRSAPPPSPPPVALTTDSDRAEALAVALDAAPWISSGAGPDGATPVWLVAPLDCALCDRWHGAAVRALAPDGEVRAIVFPSDPAPPNEAAVAAALAQRRDWALFQRFTLEGMAPLLAAAPADDADQEGFAYWARASVEALAAFGVPLDGPALIWRGAEGGYRALIREAALDPVAAQRVIALDRAKIQP